MELENFSLVHASDQASVISPLQVIPQNATFPVSVGKGEHKTVSFVLDDQKLLPQSDKAAICAEPLRLVGAVHHTLGGGETLPVSSPSLVPSGC